MSGSNVLDRPGGIIRRRRGRGTRGRISDCVERTRLVQR